MAVVRVVTLAAFVVMMECCMSGSNRRRFFVAQAGTWTTDVVCQPLTECNPPSQMELRAPTPFTDRVCVANPCSIASLVPSCLNNGVCAANATRSGAVALCSCGVGFETGRECATICAAGEVEVIAPRSGQDRVCKPQGTSVNVENSSSSSSSSNSTGDSETAGSESGSSSSSSVGLIVIPVVIVVVLMVVAIALLVWRHKRSKAITVSSSMTMYTERIEMTGQMSNQMTNPGFHPEAAPASSRSTVPLQPSLSSFGMAPVDPDYDPYADIPPAEEGHAVPATPLSPLKAKLAKRKEALGLDFSSTTASENLEVVSPIKQRLLERRAQQKVQAAATGEQHQETSFGSSNVVDVVPPDEDVVATNPKYGESADSEAERPDYNPFDNITLEETDLGNTSII